MQEYEKNRKIHEEKMAAMSNEPKILSKLMQETVSTSRNMFVEACDRKLDPEGYKSRDLGEWLMSFSTRELVMAGSEASSFSKAVEAALKIKKSLCTPEEAVSETLSVLDLIKEVLESEKEGKDSEKECIEIPLEVSLEKRSVVTPRPSSE